jgi:hypothetical protein
LVTGLFVSSIGFASGQFRDIECSWVQVVKVVNIRCAAWPLVGFTTTPQQLHAFSDGSIAAVMWSVGEL